MKEKIPCVLSGSSQYALYQISRKKTQFWWYSVHLSHSNMLDSCHYLCRLDVPFCCLYIYTGDDIPYIITTNKLKTHTFNWILANIRESILFMRCQGLLEEIWSQKRDRILSISVKRLKYCLMRPMEHTHTSSSNLQIPTFEILLTSETYLLE